MICRQYGKHKINLPENVANSIDSIICIFFMYGYKISYKSSTANRSGNYKGRAIESTFRLKIRFTKGI